LSKFGFFVFRRKNRVHEFRRAALKAEKGMDVVMVTHNPANAEQIVAQARGFRGTVMAVDNTAGFADILKDVEAKFGSVEEAAFMTGNALNLSGGLYISDRNLGHYGPARNERRGDF
jgi:uroporphyrinogen-III decarboxylase